MTAKYWESDESFDLDEVIDRQVGFALQEYICDDDASYLTLSLALESDGAEIEVIFSTGPNQEFEKRKPLFDLLVEELGSYRPGGPDDSDLFYKPLPDETEQKVLLLQALTRAYLDWKEKQSAPDSEGAR